MTPETFLKTLSFEIHSEITMLEGKGQVELMTGDFVEYEKTKTLLVEVATIVGIDLKKYCVVS